MKRTDQSKLMEGVDDKALVANQDPQDQLIAEFSKYSDWESKYQAIIQLGKQLKALPEELKTTDALVRGCQSQVWLHARLVNSNQGAQMVEFQADSDALIVRGLVAMLLKVYSGMPAKKILETQPRFLTAIGLDKNLSPSRTNGLNAMLKQMKNFALVFSLTAP